jgi:hypothetical protein
MDEGTVVGSEYFLDFTRKNHAGSAHRAVGSAL